MERNPNVPKGEFPVLAWAHPKLPKQKGMASYTITPNQMKPSFLLYNPGGFFNMIRRSRAQFLYVVPPFVIAWYSMQWAIERNEYLNSKAGRAEYAEDSEG